MPARTLRFPLGINFSINGCAIVRWTIKYWIALKNVSNPAPQFPVRRFLLGCNFLGRELGVFIFTCGLQPGARRLGHSLRKTLGRERRRGFYERHGPAMRTMSATPLPASPASMGPRSNRVRERCQISVRGTDVDVETFLS